LPPWNQQHIRRAYGYGASPGGPAKSKKAPPAVKDASNSVHRGHWAVKVLTPGDYEISLRRWPVEADQPITAPLPPGDDVPGASKAFRTHPGVAIPAVTAVLRIDSRDLETKPVEAGDRSVTFTTTLTAGSYQLAPVFVDAEGNEVGAYYAIVTWPLSST
jgi:hypothetical protein